MSLTETQATSVMYILKIDFFVQVLNTIFIRNMRCNVFL